MIKRMKRYRYILLDWDGNLVKTLDIWLEACREALVKKGFALSDEEIAACFGAFETRFRSMGVENVGALIDEIDRLAKQKLPEAEFYPDALEVLEVLKQRGKKLALLTTSFRANLDHLLKRYRLSDSFEAIIANEDVRHFKPHPESIETALARINGVREQAVMIGDSDKDIGAATNAGIDSILFYPPEHKKYYDLKQLRKLHPTHVVTDLRQILPIIG
jgi:pyrophosphatase PpaX